MADMGSMAEGPVVMQYRFMNLVKMVNAGSSRSALTTEWPCSVNLQVTLFGFFNIEAATSPAQMEKSASRSLRYLEGPFKSQKVGGGG